MHALKSVTVDIPVSVSFFLIF